MGVSYLTVQNIGAVCMYIVSYVVQQFCYRTDAVRVIKIQLVTLQFRILVSVHVNCKLCAHCTNILNVAGLHVQPSVTRGRVDAQQLLHLGSRRIAVTQTGSTGGWHGKGAPTRRSNALFTFKAA